MPKLAIVFPGQGSQRRGMLGGLAAEYSIVEETFAEASAAIGLDLWDLVQFDRNGLLDQTAYTQPALLAASIALWRLWRERSGREPALLAGHSLGEYSALMAAGVIDFDAAVELVHKRGKFMQEAVPAGAGGMAAVIGLDTERLERLCAAVAEEGVGNVSAANFNSPIQTVIAGDAAAVSRAGELCREAGAKRVLPLQMSVPSHCELMAPAKSRLEIELAKLDFRPAAIPVVQNVTGRASGDPDEIRRNLAVQLCEPVRWMDCIETMTATGIDAIVECGPGKVLNGLIKRIAPRVATWNCDEPDSLERAAAETA